ncbi:MAG: hypothetical protein ABJG15_03230 [Hyphomonadaceae bacterium]
MDKNLGVSAALIALVLASGTVAHAQDETIDFGNNESNWANDGECDDPRFEGDGMASSTNRETIKKDANDCRSLLEEGRISYSSVQYDPDLTSFNGIELGDNTSPWANDNMCDDPRFVGEGMAVSPMRSDILHDRNDCSYGVQLGTLTLADNLPDPVETTYDGVDFGNDKGTYVNDNECDDPRFFGVGMASASLDNANLLGDRLDCLAAYKDGKVDLKERLVLGGFFFGDDTSLYANDDECDDPRFEGRGSAKKPALSGLGHDGTDCMAAWRAERITPVAERDNNGIMILSGILFGDDSSQFNNDGECDDPQFIGRSMANGGGSNEHRGHDRTDCLTAFQSGSLKIAPVIPVKQSISVSGIDFGDDQSAFSNDGECDDPRFEGEASSISPQDSNRGHDASDCLAAFQNGGVVLVE